MKYLRDKANPVKRRHAFSLIEMVIAAMILAMASVIVVEMNSRSMRQTGEIESGWAREHLLTLGCEYFLLWGHEASEPNDLLPKGYSISCEIAEKEDEDASIADTRPQASQYIRASYTIRLYSQGSEIASRSVTKLIPFGAIQ